MAARCLRPDYRRSDVISFDLFETGPHKSGEYDSRGIAVPLTMAGVAIFVATLAPLIILLAIAPGDLRPVRVDMLHVWRAIAEREYPLQAVATEEGRGLLEQFVVTQTHLAYAAMLALGVYFCWRGFVSRQTRGWTHFFWIAGACLFFFAPTLAPELSPQRLDHLATFWIGIGRGHSSHSETWRQSGRIQTALPDVLMVARAALAALASVFVAVCMHDMGYRLKEAMVEFGLIADEAKASRGPSARGSASAGRSTGHEYSEAETGGQAHGFGYRDPSRPRAPLQSPLAQACSTLGVSVGASRAEIERAYRTRMKTAHPDHGGSVERAAALNQARDLLLPHG